MKKLLSLILTLSLVSGPALAASPDHTKLIGKTFNEFQYKMTVEADAKDKIAQQKAVEHFKEQLIDIQKQGVTSPEIMEYLRTSILDASARVEFDRFLKGMPATISPQEASELSMKFLSQHYQAGASYQGSAIVAGVAITIIVAGIITYLVVQNNGGFANDPNHRSCDSFCL